MNVLAVLRDAIRYEKLAMSDAGWIAELTECRAAVAELIKAADKAANRLAAIGYPVDGGRYTKGGTWIFADAVPRPVDADEVASAFRILSAASARCKGQSA